MLMLLPISDVVHLLRYKETTAKVNKLFPEARITERRLVITYLEHMIPYLLLGWILAEILGLIIALTMYACLSPIVIIEAFLAKRGLLLWNHVKGRSFNFITRLILVTWFHTTSYFLIGAFISAQW
jgi:hypothetical protein